MKKVALLKCVPENVDGQTRALMELLGGMEKYVKSGDKVLIKPNVLCAQDAATGATTSPVLVESLANMCFEQGASQVIVGESSNWGIDSMEAMKACGYEAMAQRCGAELMDFKRHAFVKKEIDGLVLDTINVPQALEHADVVINCPVLKVHTMTKVTLGIKNLSVGISHDMDKQCRLHRIGLYPPITDEMEKNGSWLDCAIADINANVKTTLTVIDGVLGLHGPGAPLFGDPIPAHAIIASDDRVAADSVGSELLGHCANDVHHIRNAYAKGMGEIDIDQLEIVGDDIEGFALDIQQSFNPSLKGLPENVKVVNGCKTCRACLSTVTYVLSRHKEAIEEMAPMTVYVGKYFEQEKCPASGECTFIMETAPEAIFMGVVLCQAVRPDRDGSLSRPLARWISISRTRGLKQTGKR